MSDVALWIVCGPLVEDPRNESGDALVVAGVYRCHLSHNLG